MILRFDGVDDLPLISLRSLRPLFVPLTDFPAPVIAVKMSCLYRWTQKSLSSSKARFRRMPQPSLLVSILASVSVCSSRTLTICSLNNSFRVFLLSMRLVIARAAADLVFNSGLCRSLRTGRTRFSRSAASSGSVGGLTSFTVGLLRFFTRFLDFDLPILIENGLCVQYWWDVSICHLAQELFNFLASCAYL
jgi:hypothetical protein